MNSSNLKSIQKNIYQTYFSDGVWDLVIGLIYLMAGLGIWINQNFWYLFPIILLVLPLILKRAITFPRMGQMQIKQTKKLWISLLFFLIEAILFIFLYFISANNSTKNPFLLWLTQNLFVIIGLMIALFFVLTGKTLYFKRLYLYAVITLIGFSLMYRVIPAGIVLTFLGVLIIVISLIVIRNFIRYHPIQNNEEITQEVHS
ncbi:MAG: hypothetical protein CL609_20105 [Anaerolineaceae bacterium]|nr:hypothetical protein [Anaerolineaceae bacterium]